jgi:hypothetical protein
LHATPDSGSITPVRGGGFRRVVVGSPVVVSHADVAASNADVVVSDGDLLAVIVGAPGGRIVVPASIVVRGVCFRWLVIGGAAGSREQKSE